jgi:hypothetical protein
MCVVVSHTRNARKALAIRYWETIQNTYAQMQSMSEAAEARLSDH